MRFRITAILLAAGIFTVFLMITPQRLPEPPATIEATASPVREVIPIAYHVPPTAAPTPPHALPEPTQEPQQSEAAATPQDAPTPNAPPQTAALQPSEPQMGDMRIVDGQKQTYFLGFGWIEANDEPNVCIIADGEGDINKMVGIMD